MHEPAFEIKNLIKKNNFKKTEACANYLDFLNKHVADKYKNGIAAVFPCFYVYYHAAKKLYPENKDNDYIAWFSVYTSELFENQNQKMFEIVKKEYDSSDENKKIIMMRIIREGALLEWHFWDAFYQ